MASCTSCSKEDLTWKIITKGEIRSCSGNDMSIMNDVITVTGTKEEVDVKAVELKNALIILSCETDGIYATNVSVSVKRDY